VSNQFIWLDPFYAQIIPEVIVNYRGKGDPVNANTYQTNADVSARLLRSCQ
jgi:ABC-type Zn uptake system ZnuABC Zn-binding protein ZnuA